MVEKLRWLVFLPAGFVASVVASVIGNFAGTRSSEFIGLAASGGMAAAAFILVGLWIAPKKNQPVKWTLIIIASVLGVLSAAGSLLGDDKFKTTTGVCMVLVSLGFARLSPDQIANDA